MEICQEVLFSVAISLLVSFVLAKLLSVASACGVAEKKKTPSLSKTVIGGRKVDKESVVCEFESDKKVGFVEEEAKLNDHEAEEFRVQQIDSEKASREVAVVGLGEKGTEEGVSNEEAKESECENQVEMSFGEAEEVVDESHETATYREIEIQSVDEGPERSLFREIETELVKNGESGVKGEEDNMATNESGGVKSNVGEENEDEEEGLFDDWEGIERTELDKRFGAAVAFAGSTSNAERIATLHNDVNMELYGLHKIAIQGACCEPQPMALKVSARAKWNAWKRLGNMSPEVAMEHYIALLSTSVPEWMGDDAYEDTEQAVLDDGMSGKLPSNLQKQPGAKNERELELLKNPCVQEVDVIGDEVPNFMSRANNYMHVGDST